MPGLDIGVVLVEPDFEALIPTVKFKVQVKNAAAPHEPITSCLLSCDVYLSIGGKDKWLGKFISTLPLSETNPLTTREIEIVENFALTLDVNNAMFEHLKVLKDEDITFKLIFKASYIYQSGGVLHLSSSFYGTPPNSTLPKTATLPINKWRQLLSTYYRNLTWIAVSRETYLLLKEKVDKEGLTLDEVIRRALAKGDEK
jgi:hypothetical protein